MRLKSLREHYANRGNNTWVPKKSFTTEEEIKKELGFEVNKCNIYTCKICKKLHIATYPLKNRNVVK